MTSERSANSTLDYLKFYSILNPKVQGWLTLVALENPDKITSKDDLTELFENIYDIISKSKGLNDPLYDEVHRHLPNYVEKAHNILVGLDESEILPMDYLAFFSRAQKDAGTWLTINMLKKPDRMTHNQMVIICNLATRICRDSKSTDPDYAKVVLNLPKWISHVCEELLKLEHGV